MHIAGTMAYGFVHSPRCWEHGCNAAFYGRGLCKNHYYQWKRGHLKPRFDPAEVVWREGRANQQHTGEEVA